MQLPSSLLTKSSLQTQDWPLIHSWVQNGVKSEQDFSQGSGQFWIVSFLGQDGESGVVGDVSSSGSVVESGFTVGGGGMVGKLTTIGFAGQAVNGIHDPWYLAKPAPQTQLDPGSQDLQTGFWTSQVGSQIFEHDEVDSNVPHAPLKLFLKVCKSLKINRFYLTIRSEVQGKL